MESRFFASARIDGQTPYVEAGTVANCRDADRQMAARSEASDRDEAAPDAEPALDQGLATTTAAAPAASATTPVTRSLTRLRGRKPGSSKLTSGGCGGTNV